MDTGLATVIAAGITAIGLIFVAYINRANKTVTKAEEAVSQANITMTKAEESVAKAEESIKNVSVVLPSWNLLFEHDEQGNTIIGNVESLIDAVNKGYPIKVRIHHNDSIHVMDAEWLFVENKVVYASNTNQVSLTKDNSGRYVFYEDSYHYFVVVGSNGHHHASRIHVDGRKRAPTDSKRHMAWIGLVPALPDKIMVQ